MDLPQPRRLDAVLYPEAMQEEIVVTGQYETVSTGAQGSATVEQSLLEKLPVLRTMQAAVLLNALWKISASASGILAMFKTRTSPAPTM